MGNAESSTFRNDRPSFTQLFETDPVDWPACARSLEDCPEQALLYAHGGVEPSWVWRAIQKGAPESLVQRLLECDPDAVDQVSHRGGSTLLHLAAAVPGTSPQVLRWLLQRRPDLAGIPDRQGRLPLHRCSERSSSASADTTAASTASAATVLLEAFPNGYTRRCQRWGALPLHYALDPKLESISVDLLRVLVGHPPSSTSTSTVAAKPTILWTRDKFGRTPLQLLLQRLRKDLDDELWKVLQDWIARYLSRPGSPPLHVCIEIGGCQTLPMMQRALSEYGDDSEELHSSCRDALGRNPLHIAGLNGQVDADALAFLMDANPKAPRMTDHEGRLPIDIAAESPDTQPHCLALLIRGEPRAVNTRDLRNGCYPFLTSALSHQSSLNNTYYLLRSRPEVLSYYHTP